MTSYDGVAITYDEIGNPLTYYNGWSYSFTWIGRQLVGATKGSKNITFVYNDDGIRTGKTVNGVEHSYYLAGDLIMAEAWGDKLLVYIYDASNSPIGMMYRTTSYAEDVWDVYWYEKNLQGDIVAVYNSSGTKVATYTYENAWGDHLVSYTSTTAAQYNPFRYRGYYYDTDLGMYYLQSRYYDPAAARFINVDDISIITATPAALTDKNLFAYCDNNPIVRVDGDGEFWHIIAGTVVGAIASGIVNYAQQKIKGDGINWKEVAISALAGGCSGALATVGAGPVAGAIIQISGNALISAGESVATQALKKGGVQNVSLSEVITDSIIGGFAGRNNGLSKGVSKHLMTQGFSATKQIPKKGLFKAAGYYFSQTNTLFYTPLRKNILKDSINEIIGFSIMNAFK